MKTNTPRRKIFNDAIDVMMGPDTNSDIKSRIQEIPIERIIPFRDHPFRLYSGERLEDMIESIRTHGVLTPVIVRKAGDKYEMLAGHNRANAAGLAGLKVVPAIVKEEITDDEAYVYVIETNLMQRSFTDFLPSEKAKILSVKYGTMKCQGKRNDIIREIAILEGIDPDQAVLDNVPGLHGIRASAKNRGLIDQNKKGNTCGLIDQNMSDDTCGLIGQNMSNDTCGLIDQNMNSNMYEAHNTSEVARGYISREVIAEEYGLSGKSVARFLRVNYLIPEFKDMLDRGDLPLYAAVDLSFLEEKAQKWIYDTVDDYNIHINMKLATRFREEAESLTEKKVKQIADEIYDKSTSNKSYRKVKLPKDSFKKYFKGSDEKEIEAIMLKALELYFKTNKK